MSSFRFRALLLIGGFTAGVVMAQGPEEPQEQGARASEAGNMVGLSREPFAHCSTPRFTPLLQASRVREKDSYDTAVPVRRRLPRSPPRSTRN